MCSYKPAIKNFESIAKDIRFCVLIKQQQAVAHLGLDDLVLRWAGFSNEECIKPEFESYYSDLISSAKILHDYALTGLNKDILVLSKEDSEAYFSPLVDIVLEVLHVIDWYLGESLYYLPSLLKMVVLRAKFDSGLNLAYPDLLDYELCFNIVSDGFSLSDVSLLALMNEKSVRNATHSTKPETERLITHKVKGRTYVSTKKLALWLENRRSFHFSC